MQIDRGRLFLFGFSDGATEVMELASTRWGAVGAVEVGTYFGEGGVGQAQEGVVGCNRLAPNT